MSGGGGLKKQRRKTPETKPDLPITPMLDMSFQLMAFFILTFRPSPTEAQLALSLPKEAPSSASAPPPTSTMPEEDEEIIVQVYAADNGNVSKIEAGLKTGNLPLGEGGDTARLNAFLKEEKEKRGGKAPKLKYEFVDGLNYQYVIKMLDEARRAGYDSISPTLLGGGNAPGK